MSYLHIDIKRHGIKDGDKLTPQGMREEFLYGQRLNTSIYDRFEREHSNANRAQQTIDCICEGAEIPRVYAQNDLLNMDPIPSEIKSEMEARKNKNRPMGYDELVNKINNSTNEKGKNYGAVAAKHLARYVLQKFGKYRPKKGQPSTLAIGISHGPKVEAGLLYLIGADNVSAIGGGFKPGEGYKIEIQENDGKYSITVKYRGTSKTITMEQLEKVAGENGAKKIKAIAEKERASKKAAGEAEEEEGEEKEENEGDSNSSDESKEEEKEKESKEDSTSEEAKEAGEESS